MPKGRFERQRRNARLARINFPRVKIKNARTLLPLADSRQARQGKRQRHQPKISAAAAWPVGTQEAYRAHRNFSKATFRKRVKRMPRGIGQSIGVMMNGINA